MSNYSFIKTQNKQSGHETITITDPNGEPFSISSDSSEQELFGKVLECAKNKEWSDAIDLISQARAIKTYSKGAFEVIRGTVHVNGREVPEQLAEYIIDFKDEGLDYKPLVAFAENLFENPSKRSVDQLFAFLAANKVPITEDGCFLAYKRVEDNFLDMHTKTMDNSPGRTVEMPREQVDDNPNVTCSRGLHVAAWEYAAHHFNSGRGKMLVCKVHPRDVVSVPTDYNQQKMRCCKYLVLETVNEALITRLTSSTGQDLAPTVDLELED